MAPEKQTEQAEIPAEVQRLRDAARDVLKDAGFDPDKPDGRRPLLMQNEYRAWDKKTGSGSNRFFMRGGEGRKDFQKDFEALEANIIDPSKDVSYSQLVEYMTTQFMIDATKLQSQEPQSDLLKDMNLRRIYWMFDESMLHDYAATVGKYAKFIQNVPGAAASRDVALEGRALDALTKVRIPLKGVTLVSRLYIVRELARQLPEPKKSQAQATAAKIEDQLIAVFKEQTIKVPPGGAAGPGKDIPVRKGMSSEDLILLMHHWSAEMRATVGESTEYKVETSTTHTRLEELARSIGRRAGLPVLGDGKVDTYQSRVPHALYGKAAMDHTRRTVDEMFPKKPDGSRRYEIKSAAEIQRLADSLIAADGEWRLYANDVLARQTDVTALLFLKGQLGLYVNAKSGLDDGTKRKYEEGKLPPDHRKGLEVTQPLRNIGAMTHYVAIIQKGYLAKIGQAESMERYIDQLNSTTFAKFAEVFNGLKPYIGDIAWTVPGAAAKLIGQESLIPADIRQIRQVQELFRAARGMQADLEIVKANLAKSKAQLKASADAAQAVLQKLEERLRKGATDATEEDMKLVSDMCDSLLKTTADLADTNALLTPHIQFHALHANAYAGRQDISWRSIAVGAAATDWVAGAWGSRAVTSTVLGRIPAFIVNNPYIARIPLVNILTSASADGIRAGGALAGRGVQMTSPTYWMLWRPLLGPAAQPFQHTAEALATEWRAISGMPRTTAEEIAKYTAAKEAFEKRAIAFRDSLNKATAGMKPEKALELRRELAGVVSGGRITETQRILVDAAHELGVAAPGKTMPQAFLVEKMKHLRLSGTQGQAAAQELLADANLGPRLRAALATEDAAIRALIEGGTKLEKITDAQWITALRAQASTAGFDAELFVRTGLAGRTAGLAEGGAALEGAGRAARFAAEIDRDVNGLSRIAELLKSRKVADMAEARRILESAGLVEKGADAARLRALAPALESAAGEMKLISEGVRSGTMTAEEARKALLALQKTPVGTMTKVLRGVAIVGAVIETATATLSVLEYQRIRDAREAMKKQMVEMFVNSGFERKGDYVFVNPVTKFEVDTEKAMNMSDALVQRALIDSRINMASAGAAVTGTALLLFASGPVGAAAGVGLIIIAAAKYVTGWALDKKQRSDMRDAIAKVDPKMYRFFSLPQITGLSAREIATLIDEDKLFDGVRDRLSISLFLPQLQRFCPLPLAALDLPDGKTIHDLLDLEGDERNPLFRQFVEPIVRSTSRDSERAEKDLAAIDGTAAENANKMVRYMMLYSYARWSVRLQKLQSGGGAGADILMAQRRVELLGGQYFTAGRTVHDEFRSYEGGGRAYPGRPAKPLGSDRRHEYALQYTDLVRIERETQPFKHPRMSRDIGRDRLLEKGLAETRERGVVSYRLDLPRGGSVSFAQIGGSWMWSSTERPAWIPVWKPMVAPSEVAADSPKGKALARELEESGARKIAMDLLSIQRLMIMAGDAPVVGEDAVAYADAVGVSALEDAKTRLADAAGEESDLRWSLERRSDGKVVYVRSASYAAVNAKGEKISYRSADRFTSFNGRWFMSRRPGGVWQPLGAYALESRVLSAFAPNAAHQKALRDIIERLTAASATADGLRVDRQAAITAADAGITALYEQKELPVTEDQRLGVDCISVPVNGNKVYFAFLGGKWHWSSTDSPRWVDVKDGRYPSSATDDRAKANRIADLLATIK